MEQKAKKYDELNRYERAMTNASLEQRLEAMAKDIEQIGIALKLSVHVDTTIWEEGEEVRHGISVYMIPDNGYAITRHPKEDGDLFGMIEEALSKKTAGTD